MSAHSETVLTSLSAIYVEQQARVFTHRRAERDDPFTDCETRAEIDDEVMAVDERAEAHLQIVAARPAWTIAELRAKAQCVVAYRGELIGHALDHPARHDDKTMCLSIVRDLVGMPAIADALTADGLEADHLCALPAPIHPDAALLDLCRRLDALRAEWQRLYDLTSDEERLTTPADHEWAVFSSRTWPGVGPLMTKRASGDDLPAQLGQHRATTQEGMAAKAAAILALQDAARYTYDCRDDACDLADSLMEDVAGALYRPLGAEVKP